MEYWFWQSYAKPRPQNEVGAMQENKAMTQEIWKYINFVPKDVQE